MYLGSVWAGDEPPPEAPDGALHDAIVNIRIVVSECAGLIGEDMQVVVDDQGAFGSSGGTTRGHPVSPYRQGPILCPCGT